MLSVAEAVFITLTWFIIIVVWQCCMKIWSLCFCPVCVCVSGTSGPIGVKLCTPLPEGRGRTQTQRDLFLNKTPHCRLLVRPYSVSQVRLPIPRTFANCTLNLSPCFLSVFLSVYCSLPIKAEKQQKKKSNILHTVYNERNVQSYSTWNRMKGL